MTYWRDTLLIGVPQIDEQHKKLVKAMDELLEACAKGQGRATIEKTLLFAVSYAKEHFADEELLQVKVGYPDFLTHKWLHEQYITNISTLVRDFEQKGPNIALVAKINNTLVEWLIHHIGTEDQKIAEYIQKKNLLKSASPDNRTMILV